MQSIIRDLYADANKTATAGTIITSLMPSRARLKAWFSLLKYTAQGTAHTLTVMKPFSFTTLSAAAAASQAVIALTADPGVGTAAGAIAANDFVVITQPDGTEVIGVVSSVSGLNVTLTANLAKAVNAGAKVWFYGVPGDGHLQFTGAASATTTFGSDTSFVGFAGADRVNEPIFLHSNNATAAGTLVQLNGAYLATGPAV